MALNRVLAGCTCAERRTPRSRELVAQAAGRPGREGRGISQQAIYRHPKRPLTGQRREFDDVDRVVLEVARENPTDGTRMVAALAAQQLSVGSDEQVGVNRKRAQRLIW